MSSLLKCATVSPEDSKDSPKMSGLLGDLHRILDASEPGRFLGE